MLPRRRFLQLSSLGLGGLITSGSFGKGVSLKSVNKPIVISTWDAGIAANTDAWKVLSKGGRALDAVEKGVMVTESSINCCVGLGANPDRDGIVTLDASIMDEYGNAGAVAAIERIKHPISVARKVMENTPHVLLAGDGAQEFALSQGFQLEPQELSPSAKKAYRDWLKKSEYKPEINIERSEGNQKSAFAPLKLDNGDWNHDTIGMLALDQAGNLSGSCTTSGMAFKVRGRVGDSPLIGAGLYVDNAYGAAVSTGLGEEVIKSAGTHLVVEFMRQGLSPDKACRLAVERIVSRTGSAKAREFQVAFIALNKQGQVGAYAIQKGFSYARQDHKIQNELIASASMF
jgi:N4-(beta-N-acetylglucosaminyl)-L-asparaginase